MNFVNIADKFPYYNKLIVDRIIAEVGVNDTYAKIIESTSEEFKGKVITHFFKNPSILIVRGRWLFLIYISRI